jgi:DNA-binding IclR family transcriptional regulator
MTMEPPPPIKSRSGAQTLERGFDLLERVVDCPMSVRELVEASGLGLSTTRRLVKALVNSGYVVVERNGRVRAGPRLLLLGARAQSGMNFVDIAKEHLRKLSDATGMPSFLGERDKDYSVHLYRASGTQRVTVNTPVGTRRRLSETSLGKALLLDDSESEWDRVWGEPGPSEAADWKDEMRLARERGVVVHIAPGPDHIRAIAAPIRNASKGIVAAISIVSPAQYADDQQIQRLAPLVVDTAGAISRSLGYVPRK